MVSLFLFLSHRGQRSINESHGNASFCWCISVRGNRKEAFQITANWTAKTLVAETSMGGKCHWLYEIGAGAVRRHCSLILWWRSKFAERAFTPFLLIFSKGTKSHAHVSSKLKEKTLNLSCWWLFPALNKNSPVPVPHLCCCQNLPLFANCYLQVMLLAAVASTPLIDNSLLFPQYFASLRLVAGKCLNSLFFSSSLILGTMFSSLVGRKGVSDFCAAGFSEGLEDLPFPIGLPGVMFSWLGCGHVFLAFLFSWGDGPSYFWF